MRPPKAEGDRFDEELSLMSPGCAPTRCGCRSAVRSVTSQHDVHHAKPPTSSEMRQRQQQCDDLEIDSRYRRFLLIEDVESVLSFGQPVARRSSWYLLLAMVMRSYRRFED